MGFIGVEVKEETSAPPPKKNPRSAPANCIVIVFASLCLSAFLFFLERGICSWNGLFTILHSNFQEVLVTPLVGLI